LYRPMTVIAVRRNGRELDLRFDNVIVAPGAQKGWDDTAEKTFEPDERGRLETVTLRNDGTFIVKGSPKEWYSTRYSVGYRRDWTDFSQ
jgi:hypothetical protein